MPVKELVQMKTGEGAPVFLIHPIEGHVDPLSVVAEQLSSPVFGLQCCKDAPMDSMEVLAAHYIKVLEGSCYSVSVIEWSLRTHG